MENNQNLEEGVIDKDSPSADYSVELSGPNSEETENEAKTAGFNSRLIFNNKIKKIIFISLGGLCIVILTMNIIKTKQAKLMPELTSQTMDLDAASKAADTDKMWRQNLEDKQSTLDKALQDKIEAVKNEINQKTASNDDKKEQEIK